MYPTVPKIHKGRLIAFVAILFPLILVAQQNLILISVDTLRADHLGCYGYYRNSSPNIDAFAREGVLFAHCITESPLTVPAMSTMMTSLPAYKHGAKRNGLSIFEGLPTLAEWLQKNGYRTAGFISNWPLKDRLSGLGRGFDHYDEIFTKKRWMGIVNPEGEAEDINRAVESWLDRQSDRDRPLFLWIHYTEPHAPYIQHKEYTFPPFRSELHGRFAKKKHIDPYDSEISYTDHHIGLLLKMLKERNIYETSTVMIVGDHGESFGEHHYFQHGRRLYDNSLHIPLIIRMPGADKAGQRIETLSSLMDVAPTLLAQAGIPKGEIMEGQNLLSGQFKKEYVFSEAYKGAALLKRGEHFKRKVHPIRFAIRTTEYKLIYNQANNSFEAFALQKDPFEDREMYTALQQNLKTLRTLLISHIRDVKSYIQLSEKKFKQPAKMTQEDLDKLASLGYID